ncbi:MAG: HAD family phosphatase [Candidatus Melainabacteria bacterium]|nr:HAD family phosphatase [Candidatus Melainabacteria bacterium]
MQEIQLLAFDMGHVLIDFEWPSVCEGFYRKAGLEREGFAPVLKHLGSLGYETGRVGTVEFLKELNTALNTDIDEAEFEILWNATFRENLEMSAMLKELKNSYWLYLLSNTNESHYSYIQREFDVARHFSELILSYEVGCTKPELAIYQEVISRSGIAPGSCVFIDDLEDNISAAREVGLHAILFTTPAALKEDFRAIGVNV